jgi:hypothetical protein
MELKFKSKLFGIFILIAVFSIGAIESNPSYRNKISSYNEFVKLMSKPLVLKYGKVQGVKVVYDLLKKELYFVDGNLYVFHGDFCKKELYYPKDRSDFNKYNYSTNKHQRFLLANLNYYSYLDKYVLEFGMTNESEVDQIVFLYNQIKNNVFFKDDLHLLTNNKNTRNTKVKKVVDVQDLYLSQTYQPLNKTKGFGQLVFCDKDSVMISNIKQTDILVVNGSPNVLPVVSGIITTDLQGPLSHITLLGINRGIPIMSLENAWKNEILKANTNKKIELKVKQDSFEIRVIGNAEFEYEQSHRLEKVKIKKDLDFLMLPNVEDMDSKMISKIGAKASYFGLLAKIDFKGRASIPEGGFAIPFYYYDEHLKASGGQVVLDSLLNNESGLSNSKKKELLKLIRSKIKKHPVNIDLMKEINKIIISKLGNSKVRFRSSTNAEDIKRFNGAGLYASKSGIPNSLKKPTDVALKKVWASLWNERAFDERALFGIPQKDVAMGVLVHKAFPNEKANGVVLTKNLYRDNYPGITVSVQVGETSVVAPEPGIINDHFLAFLNSDIGYTNQPVSVDWVSRSSLNSGLQVLSDIEIENLVIVVALVKRVYYDKQKFFSLIPYSQLHLDIEFKIDDDSRQLYIKQVRSLDIK